MSAWYTFNQRSENGFVDENGNGHDIKLHGDAYGEANTPCGNAVRLDGENGYMEMPPESLDVSKKMTLEMWLKINPRNYWERAFDFGREENGKTTAYMFFAPAARRVALSNIGHYSSEIVLEIDAAEELDRWIHFVFELCDGAVFVYINGKLSASRRSSRIKMSDYEGLNRLYFGKSQYENDPYFCGYIGGIRLYDRLLSSREVFENYFTGMKFMAENEIASLDIKLPARLTENISLPKFLPGSCAELSWSSGDKAVISDSGIIFRPDVGLEDVRTVLTAYVKRTEAEKSFNVTVAAKFAEREKVEFDLRCLSLCGNLSALTHDLILPETGPEGSSISWRAEGAITDEGKIVRPSVDGEPAHAVLVAKASYGAEVMEKRFDITILPEEETEGYLFAYFTGNNANEERLHYAITRDCRNFTPLNGGRHVLRQTKGTLCLRDPFIIRGLDGFYYLVATDMQSSKGWDSNRGIITWKSSDLIHWFDETVIDIAGKFPSTIGADRIWAPQVIFDEERGEYMIYFAVRIRHENPYSRYMGLSGDETHMWYAYTKDFKTLTSEPRLLFRPVHGQGIDGDIYFKDGLYYMYYKDESNARIKLTTATSPSGPYGAESEIETQLGVGLEGVCVYKVLGEDRWNLIADAYGSNRYIMIESTDMRNFTPLKEESYSFKGFHPRHGHVVPISARQLKELTEKFGAAQ